MVAAFQDLRSSILDIKDHQVANTGVILKTAKAQVKQKTNMARILTPIYRLAQATFHLQKQVQPISTHPISLLHGL